MDSERLAVSVEEAARMVGISRALLYQMVTSGEVPSLKVGGRRLVPVSSLKTWVETKAGMVSE